eukprot:364946-Chlamydomonas_euryale.AAC.3
MPVPYYALKAHPLRTQCRHLPKTARHTLQATPPPSTHPCPHLHANLGRRTLKATQSAGAMFHGMTSTALRAGVLRRTPSQGVDVQATRRHLLSCLWGYLRLTLLLPPATISCRMPACSSAAAFVPARSSFLPLQQLRLSPPVPPLCNVFVWGGQGQHMPRKPA